jgi:hypothetical protein
MPEYTFRSQGVVDGVEYVTVLDSGGNPMQYNLSRPEAEREYLNLEVEIEWSETVHYRSTIRLNREGLISFAANELPDYRPDVLHDVRRVVRSYVEAGEESDWFDEVNTNQDLVGISDRQITSYTPKGTL